MFPSFNPAPMSNTDFAVPYQLLAFGTRNPMVSLDTSEVFFSSLPFLLQQRIDALASSSLRLEQVASSARRPLCSASMQLPNPVLSSNEDGLMSRRAAEQQGLLYQLQNDLQRSCGGRGSTSATSTNPPIQWPSSPVGLGVGDTEAISSLPIHPRWPQRVSTSLPMPSTTSMLSCAASMAELASPFTKEEEGRIPRVSGPESFPMVLHRAIAELELIRGGMDIAAFLPDGRSFHIKNKASFESKVLPVFFPKMKNFASFQRQLNLYDFRRVGGARPDRGAYHHKQFLRDYPARSCRMTRTKIKGGTLPRVKPSISSKQEAETTVATDLTCAGEPSYEAASYDALKINTENGDTRPGA